MVVHRLTGGGASDDLARAYQDRVDTFVAHLDIQKASSLLLGERASEKPPSQHRCVRSTTRVCLSTMAHFANERVGFVIV